MSDSKSSAAALRKAMKGFGTDDSALIRIVCNKTYAQLCDISRDFNAEFKRDLLADIKSETSQDFERVLVALMTSNLDKDVAAVKKSIPLADTLLTCEILINRTAGEVKEIAHKFEATEGKTLASVINDRVSAPLMKAVYLNMVNGRTAHAPNLVNSHVEALRVAGEGKVGTDEKAFVDILTGYDRAHAAAVAEAYVKSTGNHLGDIIKSEFSGSMEQALLCCVTPPADWLADQLLAAFNAVGVDDRTMIRVICGQKERSFPGMAAVSASLVAKSQKDLAAWVAQKGHHAEKKALNAIVANFCN